MNEKDIFSLVNLYEVPKSLRFELKPTEETFQRLHNEEWYREPRNIFAGGKAKINGLVITPYHSGDILDKHFLESARDKQRIGLEILRKVGNWIQNKEEKSLLVRRELFLFLVKNDHDRSFYHHPKNGCKKIGEKIWMNQIIERIDLYPRLVSAWGDRFVNLEDAWRRALADTQDIVGNERVFRKRDVSKRLKRMCRVILQTEEWIGYFCFEADGFYPSVKEEICRYGGFSDVINKSEGFLAFSENSEILVRKFGFNYRALDRKVDDIENELRKLRDDFSKLDEEKQFLEKEKRMCVEKRTQWLNKNDDIVRKWNEPKVANGEKYSEKELTLLRNVYKKRLEAETLDGTQIEQKISGISVPKLFRFYLKERIHEDGNERMVQETGTKDFAVFIGKWKNLKMTWGIKKVDLHNKEAEAENQRALSHYARVLKKGDKFYLALIAREQRQTLRDIETCIFDPSSSFRILQFHSLTFKALIKLTFEGNMEPKPPSKVRIAWERKSFKDEDGKNSSYGQKDALAGIIEYLEKFIKANEDIEHWSFFRFRFDYPGKYRSLEEFGREVTRQGFFVEWKGISEEEFFAKYAGKDIELYQIYNKDFLLDSRFVVDDADREHERTQKERTGKPNLFTMYWRNLFTDAKGTAARLGAEGKFYIRKKIEEESQITETVKQRSEDIPERFWAKRFAQDKFLADFFSLHYPAKPTPKTEADKEKFTEFVQRTVRNKPFCVIGIDRGENNLATYCVLDERGAVVREEGQYVHGDLSLVNNKGVFVERNQCRKDDAGVLRDNEGRRVYDYAENFKETAKKRKESVLAIMSEAQSEIFEERKALFDKMYSEEGLTLEEERRLTEIEKDIRLDSVEEIKSGFTAFFINKITDLVLKHNAFVILEDSRTKRSIEQIIQKTVGATAWHFLEERLARKLNYLLKKGQIEKNALQLTYPVKVKSDFKKEQNRIGNILFVDDYLTSQMCPNCGFCLVGDKGEAGRLPKFANPFFSKDITLEKEADQDVLIWEPKGKKFVIRHLYAVKPSELDKIKKLKNVNSKIRDLLVPRLKNRKGLYYREIVKRDPVFCSACGFNTENARKGLPIFSGDDAAAYNIAKIGLEVINSSRDNQL